MISLNAVQTPSNPPENGLNLPVWGDQHACCGGWLQVPPGLKVREMPGAGFYVPALSKNAVGSYPDIEQWMEVHALEHAHAHAHAHARTRTRTRTHTLW